MSIELTTISNSLNGPEKIDKVLTQVRLTCTSVSKERDVPGQTGTGRPVIPLSRDKKKLLSQCHIVLGQGQEQMSRDKLLCPGTKRFKNFQKKKTRFPILEHHFSVLEHPFLF